MHEMYKERAQAFRQYNNDGIMLQFSSAPGRLATSPFLFGSSQASQPFEVQVQVWHDVTDSLKCENPVCHNRKYLIADTGEYMPVCSRRCAGHMTFRI